MMIRYKIDVIQALADAGYSPSRIRKEKLFGESYMTQFRRGELVSWKAIDTACELLKMQPGELLEHISDSEKIDEK